MSEERTERMMEGRKQGWEREVGETEIMRERWGRQRRDWAETYREAKTGCLQIGY